jgi:hypothetical protein
MEHTELIQNINKELAIELPEKIALTDLEEKLAAHINYLIEKDFGKLVSLLYRIDISENKLKNLLHIYADENAGKIIAQLIITRQLEKTKSRRENTKPARNDDEFEKW